MLRLGCVNRCRRGGRLPPDRWLRDGGSYRHRRHDSYVLAGGTLERVAHRAHFQPVEYNALHGGLQRWFEPAQHGRAQALYVMIGYGLGGALGVLVASWVWTAVSPQAVFVVSAAAAVLGAWAFRQCREP